MSGEANRLPDGFQDLLAWARSADRRRLVDDLYTALGTPEPPAKLREYHHVGSAAPQGVPRCKSRMRRFTPVFLIAALVILVSGVAFAAEAITNLGNPTNAVPDYGPPLGGFRYVGVSLRQRARPAVLFLTVGGTEFTDPEGWPLVKALDQFGAISGLTPLPSRACGGGVCDQPGFDFKHARYRSRYLSLESKEIAGYNGQPAQHLSSQELIIFNRFVKSPPRNNPVAAANRAASLDRLPLIAIAGYLQLGSNFVSPSDFVLSQTGPAATGSNAPYASFDQARQALAAGKTVGGLQPGLVRDVDIETNVLVALMCRADHQQPASVCNRTVIKHILKNVR